MNSGCYGSEFKDIVLSVQAVDYNGNIITIPSKKLNLIIEKVIYPTI